MRKLRVLVLVDEEFVPPDTIEGLSDDEIAPWKTEYDVVVTLEELGHEPHVLGVASEVRPIREAIEKHKPHVVFNLLEEFRGEGVYVPYLLGYLELIRQPYTGCNPGGMLMTHSKALSKKILKYHRIPVPDFAVFRRGKRIKRPRHLGFPLIVKSATEHGSVGISQGSIVSDDAKLADRVERIHDQLETDAMAEQYIEGRELYVGVMGNNRLQTLPIWELLFTKLAEGSPRIATEKVKWDLGYQARIGLKTKGATGLSNGLAERIFRVCKRAYRTLGQTGYARMDLRLTDDGRVYLLESNPNPQLAYGEDLAESAHSIGIKYEKLIQRIVNLGLQARKVWQG